MMKDNTYTLRDYLLERGRAFIVDSRDGTVERAVGHAKNCSAADADAFHAARQECAERNEHEGWTRFLPVTSKAACGLGLRP